MMIYALALSMVPLALGCGAGTGPITATPTMKFTYSPPRAWTYNVVANAKGGQSLSEAAAQARINSDIEFAVIKAVESYGYSTSGVSVRNAVKPDPATLVDTAATCPTTPPAAPYAAYVASDEALTLICDVGAATATKEFKHEGVTITITSPVALAQSNWDNIATKVWASLSSNAGVKFYGLIEVV